MAKETLNNRIRTHLNTSLTLQCEIIETFENKSETTAKIKFNPGILELKIDTKKQYCLGDEISVSGKLTIENIEQIRF